MNFVEEQQKKAMDNYLTDDPAEMHLFLNKIVSDNIIATTKKFLTGREDCCVQCDYIKIYYDNLIFQAKRK